MQHLLSKVTYLVEASRGYNQKDLCSDVNIQLVFWSLIELVIQTVKFGLRGECIPHAEILAEFLSAHFQENPTNSAYFLCYF
jgi:hypothetical protein